MHRLLVGVCLLALAGVTALAADDTKPQKPVETWKELLTKYRGAKTPAERNEVLETYSKKFLDYAAKNSKDESGLEALNFLLQIPVAIKGNPQGKAAEMLRKNYIDNKDAAKGARAKACTLYLGAQEKVVTSSKDAKAVAAAKKEMEDVRKVAREDLKGLVKDMFVGATMPELKSKSLDDKDVKLSDLKGKVVMLDIWATWCPPCRAMIPHSKKMVEKLKGKPFVLVGVSADAKKETLTAFMEKNDMPWTHWWNGAQGGVLSELGITAFPTIYLVDHTGVIRNKWIGSPGGEVITSAVEALVKEAEDKTKGKST
jgi:thiol-disulfide isomerase/thioredoxin